MNNQNIKNIHQLTPGTFAICLLLAASLQIIENLVPRIPIFPWLRFGFTYLVLLPFLLRYGQGLSIADIAAVASCPSGTIQSRLFYTVRQLADRLRPFDPTCETLVGDPSPPVE